MANNGEKLEAVTNFLFSGSKITAPWMSAIIKVDSILKSRGVTLPTKYSQSYCFSSSHVWMLELPERRLSASALMLSNCDAGEDS